MGQILPLVIGLEIAEVAPPLGLSLGLSPRRGRGRLLIQRAFSFRPGCACRDILESITAAPLCSTRQEIVPPAANDDERPPTADKQFACAKIDGEDLNVCTIFWSGRAWRAQGGEAVED